MQARRLLPAALQALERTLAENRLTVVDTERWVVADPEGAPPLHGEIDLLAADGDGRPAILDVKWTRSRKHRLDELQEGRAIQLATYGAMTSDVAPARGGHLLATDLDQGAKVSPFGLVAETDGEPDRSDPLADRRLRFWPWPYGVQKKDTGLDEAAAAAPEGRAATRHEPLERTRLLYVGATRAKDHLVFAVNGKKEQTWLQELRGEDRTPLVRFDDDHVRVGDRAFPMKPAIDLSALADPTGAPDREHGPVPVARTVHPPRRLQPSAATVERTPQIVEVVHLGRRIPLAGSRDMRALGEACHGFFAWDAPGRDEARRAARARAILGRGGVAELAGEDLLTMSDRLQGFLTQRFPGASSRHEWPLHVPRGRQVVTGRIDLLVDLGTAFAILDHKSFPARIEGDEDRLRAFAGQAALDAETVEAVTGRPCREVWLHQPVAGRASRIAI